MLQSPLAILSLIATVCVCGYALVAGGRTERLGGALFFIGYAIANLITAMVPSFIKWGHIAVDAISLIGFIGLCWKAPHPWPLWATGCVMASVAVNLIGLTNVQITMWVYMTVLILAGYGVLLSLLVGTLAAIRRRKSQSIG